jgi:protein ImuB
MSSASKPRQIAAVYLHSILVELVAAQVELRDQLAGKKSRPLPRAVVWLQNAAANSVGGARISRSAPFNGAANRASDDTDELDAKTTLDAVNAIALQYGVKAGQTIAEARALVANLQVATVEHRLLQFTVERIAEVLGRFGATVAFELPDTVWVDVTGATHLFGGPSGILEEMRLAIEELGHAAHLALSDGPQLAKAFARWEPRRRGQKHVVVTPEEKLRCLQALPTSILPLDTHVKIALAQLGILSLGDLMAIDPTLASSRLGDTAHHALALLQGEDTAPLCAFRPLKLPCETVEWDDATRGTEAILFALRRLTAQIAARLKGRGLAAETLRLTLKGDAAIARFRDKPVTVEHEFQLAAPLSKAEDLWRVLVARVNKLQVEVPTLGVTLEVRAIQEAKQRQLDLAMGFSKLDASDPERLAVLFGELAADIGTENFGVLRLANSHKPEKVTLLSPMSRAGMGGSVELHQNSKRHGRRRSRPRAAAGVCRENLELPTIVHSDAGHLDVGAKDLPNRLLPRPIPVNGRFRVDELLPLGQHIYTIAKVKFQRRLDAVEWWSNEPCSRDYVQLLLTSGSGQLQVLAYVDRITQQRYIQGWYD